MGVRMATKPKKRAAPKKVARSGRGRNAPEKVTRAAEPQLALGLLEPEETPELELESESAAPAGARRRGAKGGRNGDNGSTPRSRTADELAGRQRSISVSEFFLKNRHLLGFDNPAKALLTTVKEAVDNSLDACEEAGILPELEIAI